MQSRCHGVRLPDTSHNLPAAITSFHQLTASTNRLQLQVDRGGGRRVVAFAVKHYHAATLPSNAPYMGRYLLYCTCTVLVCWASDGCYLFPISPPGI